MTGFPLGVNKLKLLQTKAELLGDYVGRDGREPSPERMKAIQEFPPLMDLKHLQSFPGCTNWVRGYLPHQYGVLVKILGAWLKPGAKFPLGEKGLQAVKAIKKMVKDHMSLAVMDEAAAMDGTRPLEQIADASGIAWGGWIVQVTTDLYRFQVLAVCSGGFTPAQHSCMRSSCLNASSVGCWAACGPSVGPTTPM